MTAHYDKPYVMYKKLITINDEEVYVKRIGDQFLIHEMIFKYVSPFIQSISQTLFIRGIDSLKKRTLGSLNIQELINAKIAESLNHKEKLGVAIEEQIADAWNIIESQKRMFERCEKAILFLESKQLDSTRLIEIKSLVEIQLTVSFMRYDLACSMSTYLTVSSNTEHSIAFMERDRAEEKLNKTEVERDKAEKTLMDLMKKVYGTRLKLFQSSNLYLHQMRLKMILNF